MQPMREGYAKGRRATVVNVIVDGCGGDGGREWAVALGRVEEVAAKVQGRLGKTCKRPSEIGGTGKRLRATSVARAVELLPERKRRAEQGR